MAIGLIALAIDLTFGHPTFDDPWITYRVAENLLAGQGFVYNAGERILVTTTPLYTLLLAALGWLFGDIPRLGVGISVLSAAAGSSLLYVIGARSSRLAGIVAGLFYCTFPFLPTTFGMETAFLIFLALLAVYFYLQRHLAIAALLLGLATLTRMDAVLLGVALILYEIWTSRHFPRLPSLIYSTVIAPWFVFSYVYFGAFFPATLGAKRAQEQLGWFQSFGPGAADYALGLVQASPALSLVAPLVLLGVVAIALRERWGLPILAWAVAFAAGYQLLAVPFYHWYLGEILPALALATGLGASLARDLSARVLTGRRSLLAPLLLTTPLLVAGFTQEARWYQQPVQGRTANYPLVGQWLAKTAPPTALVESMEIGIIGYYSRLPTIDFVGLTRPAIARHLNDRDVAWSLFHYWPDYVVLSPGDDFEQWVKQQAEFRDNYASVFTANAAPNEPVSVYRLRIESGPVALSQQDVNADFGGVAKLRGLAVNRLIVHPGDTVLVMLRWEALKLPPGTYSSYVHVVDASWNMHAQSDNLLDLSERMPGRTFPDPHVVQIPNPIAAGQYQIAVGLYRRDPIRNLSTQTPDGPTANLVVASLDVIK